MVKGIRRGTRKHRSAEKKIRIVLARLRGEDSITKLWRREGVATSLYYSSTKGLVEVGKKRLASVSARQV